MRPVHYDLRAADCASFVRSNFPRLVRQHSGAPFKRPAWVDDSREYASGYYWQNIDGDRFYFDTFESAAADVCRDMGVTATELDTGKEAA